MYLVPGMQLIAQQRNMSCWYASAQMVIQWKRRQTLQTSSNLIDPSENPVTTVWEVTNNGITNPQVIQLATAMGLRQVPPMTLNMAGLEKLLRQHGPLWTNGKTHITVIAGVAGTDKHNPRICVYDPWPVGVGQAANWRPYSSYLSSGGGVAARDTAANVQAVFLYAP